MFELSTNIEYMFLDAGVELEQRIEAAAKIGIRKVEMFSPENRNAKSLSIALRDNNVMMWTVLNDPRTILADARNHPQFVDNFKRTAQFAAELGCPHVVCGSGTGLPFIPREPSLQAAADAIASVVDIAADHDLVILLEAVNARVDHPGVLFSATSDSYAVAQRVNSPQVKILYDLYHSVAEGESPLAVFPEVVDRVGHVQLADFPRRGEPGSGGLDWASLLRAIGQAGYDGVIGVECHPTVSSTTNALERIRSLVLES